MQGKHETLWKRYWERPTQNIQPFQPKLLLDLDKALVFSRNQVIFLKIWNFDDLQQP